MHKNMDPTCQEMWAQECMQSSSFGHRSQLLACPVQSPRSKKPLLECFLVLLERNSRDLLWEGRGKVIMLDILPKRWFPIGSEYSRIFISKLEMEAKASRSKPTVQTNCPRVWCYLKLRPVASGIRQSVPQVQLLGPHTQLLQPIYSDRVM